MSKTNGKSEAVESGRRDFLKLAGLSAPAAAAAVAVSGGNAQAELIDPSDVRMKDTPHTRAYFDSARF